MAAFFLLTFFMESYLLRFKRQQLSWLKSIPAYRVHCPVSQPGADVCYYSLVPPATLHGTKGPYIGSPTPSLYIPTTRRLEQYLDAAAVWEEGGAVGLESSSRQQ